MNIWNFTINIIPMSKDQTASKKVNEFSLIRLRGDCYYGSTTADFVAPPAYANGQPRVSSCSNSIVPKFYNDRQSFTPAFIQPRDQEYFVKTADFEREKFQSRISKANQLCAEDEDENAPINSPMPANGYCQICKCGYVCYLTHINETSHVRQSRFSKANTYIGQLCRRYSKTRSKATGKPKTKTITKKHQTQTPSKPATKPKKIKGQTQSIMVFKYQNYSTNVPSLVPTPQC